MGGGTPVASVAFIQEIRSNPFPALCTWFELAQLFFSLQKKNPERHRSLAYDCHLDKHKLSRLSRPSTSILPSVDSPADELPEANNPPGITHNADMYIMSFKCALQFI